MSGTEVAPFIDEAEIEGLLAQSAHPEVGRVRDILAKAAELRGLDSAEVAALSLVTDPALMEELAEAARAVKEEIYGRRVVLFAPLYISNLCANDCLYCAFRAANRELDRRALTQQEIAAEVESLVDQGHKRVLLVAGESYPTEGFAYVLRSIETVYSVKRSGGEIRRVNANIAPLTVEQFRELKAARIGTYQLFQETYHRETYAQVHVAGRKRDYDWRITGMDRAMEAGIDDVGIGPLLGLYDWQFEIQALLQHIRHLEQKFGVGPHTISVPRLEPAVGSPLAAHPPHAVSDRDFCKLVAILRLAVPYTGIIMSTRERPEVRRATFALGVSQISAGSRTHPGGYAEGRGGEQSAQFQLGDHRPIEEVVRDMAGMGYLPSFCTACYRMGRTGRDFMDLAKPGEIKNHCAPNALSTFLEYLLDYGSPQAIADGERLIESTLHQMDDQQRTTLDFTSKVGYSLRETLGGLIVLPVKVWISFGRGIQVDIEQVEDKLALVYICPNQLIERLLSCFFTSKNSLDNFLREHIILLGHTRDTSATEPANSDLKTSLSPGCAPSFESNHLTYMLADYPAGWGRAQLPGAC